MFHLALHSDLTVNLLRHVPDKERVFFHDLESNLLSIPLVSHATNDAHGSFSQAAALNKVKMTLKSGWKPIWHCRKALKQLLRGTGIQLHLTPLFRNLNVGF